jgi:GntR family transcriptional repressor for pyruvate dehydrogenase complex
VVDWSGLDRVSLSRSDGIAVDLERMILDGVLKPGDRIPPERELAVTVGVSRSSVRDALRDLEMRGLIDRKPGRGTVVKAAREEFLSLAQLGSPEDLARLTEAMEVRAIIEPPTAFRAATRATKRNIAQLNSLLDDMTADLRPSQFAEIDRLFHRTVAQCTQNAMLGALTDTVNDLIEPSRASTLQTKERRRTSIEGHRAIVRAIEAHDGQAAYESAAIHIASVRDRILEGPHPGERELPSKKSRK